MVQRSQSCIHLERQEWLRKLSALAIGNNTEAVAELKAGAKLFVHAAELVEELGASKILIYERAWVGEMPTE